MKKSNKKLYFKNEDEDMCYPLQDHIKYAIQEGLKEIELIEAIPDTKNKKFVWCIFLGQIIEKSTCNKKCIYYSRPDKGYKCEEKGKLMTFGKKIRVSILIIVYTEVGIYFQI